MRLLRLAFTAIGPFPGQHTIDFERLSASGLFLLEGPTGSGKSTIIDALTFALYGQPAGAESSLDRLHSDHASVGAVPTVDLVLVTSHGVFRIKRTPRYERAKQRGQGTTIAQASVVLWRLAGEEDVEDAVAADAGEVLATRNDEAGLEIQRLVGLTREQFSQTVVLPQGEFTRFLRARPDDRRAVLQQLFGTHIYAAMERVLAERRVEANRATTAARETLVAESVGFARAAVAETTPDAAGWPGSPNPAGLSGERDAAASPGAATSQDDPDAETNGDEPSVVIDESPDLEGELREAAVVIDGERIEAIIDRRLTLLRSRSEAAESASERTSGVLENAAIVLEVAREHARAVDRFATLITEQDQLAERAEDIAGLSERLAAATRAAIVVPLLSIEDRARSAREKADATLAADRADASALLAGNLPFGDDPPNVSDLPVGEGPRIGSDLPFGDGLTLRDDRPAETVVSGPAGASATTPPISSAPGDTAELIRLEGFRDEASREAGALVSLAVSEAALPRDAARVAAEKEALAGKRRDLTAQRTALAERPRTRARLIASRDEARTEGAKLPGLVERIERDRRRFDAAERTASLRTEIAKKEQLLAASTEKARAAVDREAEVRHRRITGLAGELALGLSAGDPCPVCGATEHPTPASRGDEAVDAGAVDSAVKERVRTDERQSQASAHVAVARGRLDDAAALTDGNTVSEAKAVLEAAQGAAHAARGALADAGRIDLQVTAFDEEHTALVHAIDGGERDLEIAETRLAARSESIGTTQRAVDAARGEAVSVAKRLEALRRQVSVLDALSRSWRAAAAAAGSWQRAHEDSLLALSEHGFAREQDARGSTLPTADREADQARLRGYESAVARVEHGLATPELMVLATSVDIGTDAHCGRSFATAIAAAAANSEVAEKSHAEASARVTATVRAAADASSMLRAAESAAVRVRAAVGSHGGAVAAARPVLRMAALATANSDEGSRLGLATFVLLRRFEDVVAAANSRLVDMSGGHFELERSEESERGGRRTGLGLRMLDHVTGTRRDPRTLSGGEGFYVSLALALGLADIVSAEAGGVEVGTLFVDEGFGSLDPETLDSVVAELKSLHAGGRAVGIVSHVEELKAQISERIEVRRVADGSSVLHVRA